MRRQATEEKPLCPLGANGPVHELEIVAEKAESELVEFRCRTTQHDVHIIIFMPAVSRNGSSSIDDFVAGLTTSVNTPVSDMSIMSSSTHPGQSINQFES